MAMTLRNTDILFNDGSAQSTSAIKARVLFDGRYGGSSGYYGFYPGPITTVFNSFNVSSVTKNYIGDYIINFASSLGGDNTYTVAAFCTAGSNSYGDQNGLATTFSNSQIGGTAMRITTSNSWNGDIFDPPRVSFTAFK
jgi:hypothetical protein